MTHRRAWSARAAAAVLLSAATLVLVLPTDAVAYDDTAPPDVVSAFDPSPQDPDVPDVIRYSEPRPVHAVRQEYLQNTSVNPLGEVEEWIAVAYGNDDAPIGTTAASPDGDGWLLSPLDTRPDFTRLVENHLSGEFLELPMNGGAFYAVDGATLVGLNEPAREIAEQPRLASEARADIAEAYSRSSGQADRFEFGSSAYMLPAALLAILAAVAIGAFSVYLRRSTRV
ncbi:hypothetical protein [Microbacterium sp. cx-59]|uniref:hypothetical protein n=1 Tax=Microbacterium sp. cx-59 TaxID=2891207 RepID=UPI001E29B850|nr:hypothetical protein [Microbacterium sp. cx-59]MCC4909049.1 hypothetical protein [Microbacterium sp. cx-59]